jgi:hypothetical protein
VAERRGFQKVYDLTERVLPAGIDTTVPTESEMTRHLIRSAIGASGFASAAEISYLRKGHKERVQRELRHLLHDGEIQELQIDGIKDALYTTSDKLDILGTLRAQKKIHILSPFDNAIIQRKRLVNLFDYDYVIECYVPEPKRVHGYFCLPILYGDTFAGRMDCKADSKTKVFHIKALWMEDGYRVADTFLRAFAKGLREYAAFCGSESIRVERSDMDRTSLKALKALLK